MPTYIYTARDRSGKVLNATMEAASQREVALSRLLAVEGGRSSANCR